ncbi:hypothetical protein ACHQM5_002661 [Ranunculus cassubicifolius]
MSKDCGEDNRLADMFDQILSGFLRAFSRTEVIRPLPAMLGDGTCIDLFKLFWVVREKDGYDSVTKYAMWGLVAEEIGLGSRFTSSVKLFYFKYLDTLDRWLRGTIRDRRGGIGVGKRERNFGVFPLGLKTQFEDFLCSISDQNKCDKEKNGDGNVSPEDLNGVHKVSAPTEVNTVEKFIVLDDDENDDDDVVILDKCVIKEEIFSRKRKRDPEFASVRKGVVVADDDEGVVILDKSVVEEEGFSCKRKRELLAEILNWLTETTKSSSLRKGHEGQEFRRLESCRDSSDLDRSPTPSTDMENEESPSHDYIEELVPIGPRHQAEVPEWTGIAVESDPKWLGTLHWPLKSGQQNSHSEGSIGQGRQTSCECRVPGSVKCVRFHISEKRIRLNSELGLVFYTWRFNHMGEEVSLSWTEEEEQKFKAIMSLNRFSTGRTFLEQLHRCFRTKRWTSLVSYYFNVFVLRRRTYQNRITPGNIDSDDDESEFESLSNGFGHESVTVSGIRTSPVKSKRDLTENLNESTEESKICKTKNTVRY